MRQYFKKLTALSVATVLALNLAGVNVYAEGSGGEGSTIEASPYEEEEDVPDSDEDDVLDVNNSIESDDDQIQDSVDDEVIEDKQIITGFADLDNTFFALEEKLPIDELGLPELLPVYINNNEEVVYIDVIWTCDDDYENTEYEIYTFSPAWDETNYELSMDIDTAAVPFIEVSIQNMMNNDSRESSVVTPTEDDFIFNNGVIEGLSTTYLATLTAEQKLNINLTIPASINGTPVTAIGDKAFSKHYNSKYDGCNFISLNLSKAINLNIIGKDAFYKANGITGDLIIPATVTAIEENAFRDCTGLNGELKLSKSLITLGKYAFNNCNLIGKLQLPPNLITIGDSAFKVNETTKFTGELVIPETVTEIGVAAFSGQQGITSLSFKGNKIDELPDSVFRYCIGLVGAVNIPDSIQRIGRNVFAETGLNTIYLPKIADSNNYVIEGHAFYDSKKLEAIVCSKEDYNAIYTILIQDGIQSKLGFEMTVKFVTDSEESFEPIKRLYNHAYNLEKNSNDEWVKTNYKLPEIQGKKWGLSSTEITPVSESDLVKHGILYMIDALEEPVITFSEHINKIYDGKPATLTVTASHPLAKNVDDAQVGDVVFYYTWSWNTINFSPAVLKGFDENEYEIYDVRANYAISCAVRIQTCLLINETTAKPIYTDTFDFEIFMHQAEPIVNPLCSTYTVNINGTLPEIKLSEGDTPGTITWDKGQTIKEGTHEYKWTYTPEKNSVGSYNYNLNSERFIHYTKKLMKNYNSSMSLFISI